MNEMCLIAIKDGVHRYASHAEDFPLDRWFTVLQWYRMPTPLERRFFRTFHPDVYLPLAWEAKKLQTEKSE